MIKVLAKSLGGSEHVLVGRIRNKQGEPWSSEEDASKHLTENGWTNVRFLKKENQASDGMIYRTWTDGSKTQHNPATPDQFQYNKG